MRAVQESLLKEYVRFCKSFGLKTSHYGILQLKTKNGLPLRGYFPILLHEYIKGEGGTVRLPKRFIDVQLPFILEALISVLYYDNQIFDRKFGVIDNNKIRQNLEKRNELYDTILKYARKKITGKTIGNEVLELIQEIHGATGMGQEWERKYNHYNSWKALKLEDYKKRVSNQIDFNTVARVRQIVDVVHSIPKQKSQFLDTYLSRIYLTNAVFFSKTAEFILRHSNLKQEKKDNLIHFAGLFGIMLQIVNDNCDFVPESEGFETTTKSCCDALSDLRNMNVTLPIAFHLIREKKSKTKMFLDSGANRNIYLGDEEYAHELAESHAIFYSMRVGKEIEKYALSILNSNNLMYDKFKDMANVASNNRYYRYFYGYKKHYKLYQKTFKQ